MKTLSDLEEKYKLGLDKAWRCGDVPLAVWFEDEDSGTLHAVYTDGDDGVILFQGYNEIYEYGGATLELLGCTYCGITFDDMTEIMQELRKCNSTEV